MRRGLRVGVLVATFLLLASIFYAPGSLANPDSDGDGLPDSFENATIYTQTAAGSGLPLGVPDGGAENAVATLLPWSGIVDGAYADFTVDHPDKDELTVQVGYWDGSAWVDRYVWDPGGRLLGVDLTSPVANSFVQGVVSVTATVAEDEILDRVEFYLGSTRIRTLSQPTSPETYSFSWDTRGHSAGNHQLKAVAIDKLGAQVVHEITVKIDNAPPTVSITSPSNGALVSGAVTISASASDDYGVRHVKFYVDGALISTDGSAPYGVSWNAGSTSGARTLTARAVDFAGKTRDHAISVTVDGSVPGISFHQPASGAYLKGTYRVTVRATDDIGLAKVEFRVDSGAWVDITGNFDGTYYWYDWSTGSVGDGAHTLRARATDQVGKTNTASRSVTVDNARPSVSITSPANGATVSGTVTVRASASDNIAVSKVRFYVDGAYVTADTTSPYSFNWWTPGESNGWHSAKAVAIDRAGNSASHQIRVYVRNNDCTICPTFAEPVPTGDPSPDGSGSLSLGVATVETSSSFAASGTTYTVVADLTKSRSQVTQVERDNRILPAEFDDALLHTHMAWRLVVRDWVASSGGGGGGGGGGCSGCPLPTGALSLEASGRTAAEPTATSTQGTLQAFSIQVEERSDPTRVDTDGDGLGDGVEVNTHGTYPVTVDTDGDAATDDFEVVAQTITLSVDGVSQTATVTTDPLNPDSDGDGLPDGEEYEAGMDGVITHPTDADTDGDGLSDGDEVTVHYSNATLTDTDGDGFSDWVEVNPRSLTLTVNGVTVTRSVTTLPYAEDSDGDGLTDDEEWYGTSVYGVKTDPSDPDTDGDGLPDGQERFTAETSLDQKYAIGTYVQRSLFASIAGRLESATLRYSTSGVDASYLTVRVTHAGRTLTLRNHEGSGSYLTDSSDLTGQFGSYPGSYLVKVWSDVSGGLLEDATLSFTLLTSPILLDTDGDGLNDTEELTHGVDAWITDPNRRDTDGDGWNDGYEVLTKGTSPLSTDTDGDGALDPNDIDPLRNLLVKVLVKKIHQDDPWCSPELVGVVHVNDDYIWVTQHKIASQDSFTSWLCPPLIPTTQYKTASFYYTYYADVPDDVSGVTIRASAWSIVPIFWDGLLLDTTFTYSLGASRSYTLTNGAHWMTLSVYTTYLPKIHTLALTDGTVTAQADNGQIRYVAQDRSFVFLVEATSSYSSISAGMHAFVVPRALYMESKLKARIDGGTTWPLASTEFFAEDTAQAEMSEAVTAVTGGSLTGYEAYWLLQYLLQNTTGDAVYEAVDVTSYVPLLNLPMDALNIVPWAGVTNGPTGTMPQDFWDWLGSIANTIVNGLLTAGQLIYGGLIAIGSFFVALGEAIVAWGMWLVGVYQDALQQIKQAVEKVVEVLSAFFDWIIQVVTSAFQSVVDQIVALYEDFARQLIRLIFRLGSMTAEEAAEAFWRSLLFSSFGLLLLGGFIGLTVFAKWTQIVSFGTSTLLTPLISALVGILLGAFVVSKLYDVVGSSVAEEYIDPAFDEHIAWSFTVGKFVLWLGTAGAAVMRMWKTIDAAVAQLFVASLSLVVLSLKTVANNQIANVQTRLLTLAALSGVGFALAWFTDGYKYNIGVHRSYSLFFPIATAFSVFAKGTSAVALLDDTIEYVNYVT